MPPRQHNPAMIHFRGRCALGLQLRRNDSLNQSSAARRAPVGLCPFSKHRITLRAHPLHIERLSQIPSCWSLLAHSLVPLVPAFLFPYTGIVHPPVRLVAIDMDGTLLPTLSQPSISQTISPRNCRALRAVQGAGITVAIATGRRAAYTVPLLEDLGLRADTPLIASNGAVTCLLSGQTVDRTYMPARVARSLCGVLRPFGCVVFTFDRPGRGELVLEDLEQAQGRIAMWVETNRNAIEVVKPLEQALAKGNDPIQGMAAGTIARMRQAEDALKSSEWGAECESVRTEYPARDLSILDLLPVGVSKGWALQRLAARLGVDRKETMAIGDNWNDVRMLEWAGQGIVMANAAAELRTLAKTSGWKQAPCNDDDGVAVVLENMLTRQTATARQ
jgi:Cof subfamily protein (haloacid dehalogenase superfamily)